MTVLIITHYKYSYLLAGQFLVENCLWQFYKITFANHVTRNLLLAGLKYYKDTEMKAYDITKLTVELKSDNVQHRNKTIYITVVVLFCWRRSIATGSTARTLIYWA